MLTAKTCRMTVFACHHSNVETVQSLSFGGTQFGDTSGDKCAEGDGESMKDFRETSLIFFVVLEVLASYFRMEFLTLNFGFHLGRTLLVFQERKRNPNPNFLVRIFSGGVRVFHANVWGPKSSVCPSKPRDAKLFGGCPGNFARISRGCPEKMFAFRFCSLVLFDGFLAF